MADFPEWLTHFQFPQQDWSEALAAAEQDGDERPTWAYSWPAGERFAKDLSSIFPDKGLTGKRIADIGCGRGYLGLSTFTHQPETVLFADGSPYPLQFVQSVLCLNRLTGGSTCVHHWGTPLPDGPWDIILGGDILYRPECFKQLFTTVVSSLSTDGAAYFSDPRSILEPQLPEIAQRCALTYNQQRVEEQRYTLITLQHAH